MTMIQVALVSLGVAVHYPEIASLQRKGVWAIRIQESGIAYLYSGKQAVGNACLSSEVAYIRNDKEHWRMEDAGPGKRLSLSSCERARPEDFEFYVIGEIDLTRLESALNRMHEALSYEPHHAGIDRKRPFEISASGDLVSFSWIGQSLEVYQLTWNPEDNSIAAKEYQEDVDPY